MTTISRVTGTLVSAESALVGFALRNRLRAGAGAP
jgi:hypothetical protein